MHILVSLITWSISLLVLWQTLLPPYPVRLFVIGSDSMFPALKKGDVILTKAVDQYQIGDMVAYQISNTSTIVTHRVVAIQQNKSIYQTKGDNNQIKDPFAVSQSQVVGKVILTVPKVGWLTLTGQLIFTQLKLSLASYVTQVRVSKTSFFVADQLLPSLEVNHHLLGEHISNGNFDAGFSGWQTEGAVRLVENERTSPEMLDERYVVLESTSSNASKILQTVAGQPIRTLSWRMALATTEEYVGFSEPVLELYVNQQLAMDWQWPMIALTDSTAINAVEWQHMFINLERFGPIQSLSFSVKNHPEYHLPIQVYLDEIRSSEALITPQTPLRFDSPFDAMIEYHYDNGSEVVTATVDANQDFFLQSTKENLELMYWIKDDTNSAPLQQQVSIVNSLAEVTQPYSSQLWVNEDHTLTLLVKDFISSSEVFHQTEEFYVQQSSSLGDQNSWDETQVGTKLVGESWSEILSDPVTPQVLLVRALTFPSLSSEGGWVGFQRRNAAGQVSNIYSFNW